MAIKIQRNEAGNCINFIGSTQPAYWNACLSATVNTEDNGRVNIINDIRSNVEGQVVYEFYAVPYTDFVDSNGNAFADAQAAADYITLNANVSAPVDISVAYLGVYDADNNTPNILDYSQYNNGEWYYVTAAGTQTLNGVATDLGINDQIRFNSISNDWDVIRDTNAKIAEIESSALDQYDIHVDGSYTGTIRTGSSVHPYVDLNVAIASSSPNNSIFIKGEILVPNSPTDAFILPHGLHFYGNDECVIGYNSYGSTNGDVFYFDGTNNTQDIIFNNITVKNAGGYGLYIKNTKSTTVENCTLTTNGWNGEGLSTVSAESGGTLGYNSSQSSLQSFYAGSNASNGGAIRIENSSNANIIGNTVYNNLRGIRVQDCGINGGGFVSRNRSYNNIESGIYLAVGSAGGCQNVTVVNNYSGFNSNNGILVIGGINNKLAQNEIRGNWSAGVCNWGSVNLTLRDSAIYDNNRSTYNGIGNVGDAKASVQINDAYSFLAVTFVANPNARFIMEILDTQVHNTGLGSNVDRIGLLLTSGMGSIPASDSNIINIDDVGFIGQDYAIDFSEVDITDMQVSLGDCRYQNLGQFAVKPPAGGNYSELPFSNHLTSVVSLDVAVDTLKGMISLTEGVGGNVINTYKTNELQSIIRGTEVDILQKGSDKIQLRGLTQGNVTVNGVVAGNSLNSMNDTLNSAFQMDLVEYKDFLVSEIGLNDDEVTGWYYIESPDGEFYYPLFVTETEANSIDTIEGGSGTSHTHTFDDDLHDNGQNTWYMPDTSGVHAGTSAPQGGIFGNSINVLWNEIPTGADSNYLPTFNNITYNVQEGSAINIQYKAAGMTDTFNVTGVPAGYADNGTSIIGTAEDITNGYGLSVTHTLNVTKANNFGSVQGTITINVLANLSGNEFTLVDQGGAIKFTQDGGVTTLDFNTVTFNAGSTYKFYLDGSTLQTNDFVDIVDANGNGLTGGDGLSQTGGSGPGYAGTYLQYVIPSDVAPGKFIRFTDGATSTTYTDVPLTLAGSTYSASVTGVTLEGPAANQTGTNLFDAAGQHGWLSIDEPLGAGQRLVLSGAFLADLADAMGDQNMVMIGLKDGAWANTIGNAVPTGFEGGIMLTIYRISATNFQMYGYNIATSTMTTKVTGTHLYNASQFLIYNAFMEVTSDGNNIRVGHALTNTHDANTVTYEDWTSTAKVESGDQGFGITELDVMVKGLPLSVNAGTTDADEIDWTPLSEIAVPTAPTTNATSWTKALDFSGGSEYAAQVNDWHGTNPLLMQQLSTTVPGNSTAGRTASDSSARPWATTIVFNIDNVSQQQHIWNQGEGAFTGADNIYLKLNASKQLIFGWGREGTGYNECTIHPTPGSSGYLGHNAWYGVYIAHTGERLNASDATATNLADCFDIRLMNSAGNNWTMGSNLSVPAAWTSTGYRMDREFTGSLTIGGRGSNRSFLGRVASMVVTTLRLNVDMPTSAEIDLMITDPKKWEDDYRQGVGTLSYTRQSWPGTSDTIYNPNSFYDGYGGLQMWLMGDGTSDSYANGIRNDIFHFDQNYSKLQLNNMASNDILNVTIPGLT